MNLASRLEGLLQRSIEGLFGRRAGGVQPIEVGRRLARLMEEQKQVSVSEVYAPNAFVVRLAPADHALLANITGRLSEELGQHLARVAHRQGYALVGPIAVDWQESADLAPGAFQAEASFVPAESRRAEDGAVEGGATRGEAGERTLVFRRPAEGSAPRLSVVRGPDVGRTLRLGAGENRLGRAEDNELTLSDTNVSRYHAVVTWQDGRAHLRDLGSRNGTRRNGELVDEVDLQEGDELQVGLDVLSFRERQP